jgi:hypothetical protein
MAIGAGGLVRWFHGGQPPALLLPTPFCLPEAPPAHAVSAARHPRFPSVVLAALAGPRYGDGHDPPQPTNSGFHGSQWTP